MDKTDYILFLCKEYNDFFIKTKHHNYEYIPYFYTGLLYHNLKYHYDEIDMKKTFLNKTIKEYINDIIIKTNLITLDAINSRQYKETDGISFNESINYYIQHIYHLQQIKTILEL